MGYSSKDSQEVSSIGRREWFCEQVLYVPCVHKGTSRSTAESHLLTAELAKFCNQVLEYRERDYVQECARAYLEDLIA